MKKILWVLSGAALSIILLWLAFRQADLPAVRALLTGIGPRHLMLVGATVSAELVLRGVKWAILLSGGKPARVRDATRIAAAGLGLNNLIPLRFGEAARVSMAAGLFKINLLTVTATILVEKLLDAAALAALGIWAGGTAGWFSTAKSPWQGGAALPILLLAAIVFLIMRKNSASMRNFYDRVSEGVKAIRTPVTAAALASLALGQWGLNALNYYWLADAFNAHGQIGIARSILLSAAGAASSSVPGVPGYFGSFELAVSATLRLWGLATDTALAYAAAAHLLPYLFTTAAGLIAIWLMGYSFIKPAAGEPA